MADMTRLDFHFRVRKQIIILLEFLSWKNVKKKLLGIAWLCLVLYILHRVKLCYWHTSENVHFDGRGD